eukprot:11162090-Alexandrium_andersonii.AAC.1
MEALGVLLCRDALNLHGALRARVGPHAGPGGLKGPVDQAPAKRVWLSATDADAQVERVVGRHPRVLNLNDGHISL